MLWLFHFMSYSFIRISRFSPVDIGSGAIQDVDFRPQCSTDCRPGYNMDGSFGINFWKIEWTREFEMKVFTKKAANAHSGKEIFGTIPLP